MNNLINYNKLSHSKNNYKDELTVFVVLIIPSYDIGDIMCQLHCDITIIKIWSVHY